MKQRCQKGLISLFSLHWFTSFSKLSRNNSRKGTEGFGYIRCSWGQPDIHRAAYSDIQRQTWGREREDKACSQRGRGEKAKDMLVHARKEAVGTLRRRMCHFQHICKGCNNTDTATVRRKKMLIFPRLLFLLFDWVVPKNEFAETLAAGHEWWPWLAMTKADIGVFVVWTYWRRWHDNISRAFYFQPLASLWTLMGNKVAGAGWVAAALHHCMLKMSFSFKSVTHLSCVRTVSTKRDFGQNQILLGSMLSVMLTWRLQQQFCNYLNTYDTEHHV